MLKALQFEEAVKQHFNVKSVPDFVNMKPIDTAIKWLGSEGIEARFERQTVRPGVIVFIRGNRPQYTVAANAKELRELEGVQVLGTLYKVEKPKAAAKKTKAKAADTEADDKAE